jgi:hypothetical protein
MIFMVFISVFTIYVSVHLFIAFTPFLKLEICLLEILLDSSLTVNIYVFGPLLFLLKKIEYVFAPLFTHDSLLIF